MCPERHHGRKISLGEFRFPHRRAPSHRRNPQHPRAELPYLWDDYNFLANALYYKIYDWLPGHGDPFYRPIAELGIAPVRRCRRTRHRPPRRGEKCHINAPRRPKPARISAPKAPRDGAFLHPSPPKHAYFCTDGERRVADERQRSCPEGRPFRLTDPGGVRVISIRSHTRRGEQSLHVGVEIFD
jgi:hypothetical protein